MVWGKGCYSDEFISSSLWQNEDILSCYLSRRCVMQLSADEVKAKRQGARLDSEGIRRCPRHGPQRRANGAPLGGRRNKAHRSRVEVHLHPRPSRPFAPAGEGKPAFTFIDLFAGIGGIRMPFQELGGRCVFSCEWDKFAQKTYRMNYGETPAGGHP